MGAVSSLVVVGVVALAAPAAPLAASGSHPARSRDVLVTTTAGFVDPTAPPQPLPAQGDLPVAHSALGEQARAVVALDVPADAVAATVTFRASGQPGSSYGASSVSACRVTGAWSPGAGQALASAPAVDCTGAAPVTGSGPWTFDLSHILRAWGEGAPVLGIALVDTVSAAPAEITFNIVGAEHVGTTMSAAAAVPQPTPAPVPAPAPAPAEDAGFADHPALGTSATSVVPAPTVAAPPVPATVVAGPVELRTTARAAIGLPPRPVNPMVWFLLPVGVTFLLVLRRAVSAVADDAIEPVMA